MSLKDRILKADDLGSEIVDVPEWGEKVKIKGMSGAERATVMRVVLDKDGNVDQGQLYPLLCQSCLYDPETDEKVFEPEDTEAILSKSGEVLERLCGIASRLSGIGASAVGEAEKN